MKKEKRQTTEFIILRIGAVCAILGAIITMAAGANFNNLTNQAGTEIVLRTIAAYPNWYWPAVHLGFIFGAVLWAFAFVALARSLSRPVARALGWLGAASMLVGVAVHIIDSSISGFGLSALAESWSVASAQKQAYLLCQADTLLHVMGGTWANVLNFFSGLPFILSGLAVTFSHKYSHWFGWVGIIGGIGSLLLGVLMFLRIEIFPERLYIAFAILVSLWLLIMGILMWRYANSLEMPQTPK